MVGPAPFAIASPSTILGDDVGLPNSFGDGIVALVGGGSIADCVTGAFEGTTGSGKAGMASSVEEVSIVIWTVFLGVSRWV